MRKWLVVLGLVLAVLVAADFGLRLLAQYWVGREVQRSMGMAMRPSVSLGGFPFLPRLVSGDFPSVELQASGPTTIGQLPVRAVTLSLRRVHVSQVQLLGGGEATITAEEGDGSVSMTESDVNRALPAALPVFVRLQDGKVRVVPNQGGEQVETNLTVADGQLVLQPVDQALPLAVSVRLPDLAEGLTYTGVRIRGSTAVVLFRLENASLASRS